MPLVGDRASGLQASRPARRGADAWIAATALLYGIPLITHNPGHFVNVPVLAVVSEA